MIFLKFKFFLIKHIRSPQNFTQKLQNANISILEPFTPRYIEFKPKSALLFFHVSLQPPSFHKQIVNIQINDKTLNETDGKNFHIHNLNLQHPQNKKLSLSYKA